MPQRQPDPDLDAHQERFLNDEVFSLTLMATVQRANVYRPETTEKERLGFRLALRSRLEVMAKGYAEDVSEEAHVHNIDELSRHLTKNFAAILQRERFRIGTAQKALSLYLKYLWCLGKIPTPPRCPFDSRIIETLPTELDGHPHSRWTMLDSKEDYRALVKAAKDEASMQDLSLATWELKTYNGT